MLTPTNEPHTVLRVLLTVTADPHDADDVAPTEALLAYVVRGAGKAYAAEIERQMQTDFSARTLVSVHGQIVEVDE